MNKVKLISAFGALSLLCACGTPGPPETAPPMWGKAKKEYEEKRAKTQSEKQDTENNSDASQPKSK